MISAGAGNFVAIIEQIRRRGRRHDSDDTNRLAADDCERHGYAVQPKQRGRDHRRGEQGLSAPGLGDNPHDWPGGSGRSVAD